MSAPWSHDDCAATRGELDPDVSITELSADQVDHVPVEPSPGDLEFQGILGTSLEEHGTPFLYLTPRVESVLRRIFDDESPAGRPDTESPMSTLAEIDSEVSYDKAADTETPDAGAVSETAEPVFQRRMYRIDI